MIKTANHKRFWLVAIICAILFAVTGTTFAIFAYRSYQEKELYTKTILMNTTFRDYYLLSDDVEMGSQVSGRILFTKDETSAISYIRIFAGLRFKGDFTPNGNQQRWLDIANATLVETMSGTDYRWSQSYGGYYYLLQTEESKDYMLEVTDSSVIYQLTEGITIPSNINIQTENMPLELVLRMEAIQEEYIAEYLALQDEEYLSTEGLIIREEITPIMNSAFGVQPEEKVVVTFETNGGSYIETLVYDVGKQVKLPAVSTIKKDAVFAGWCSDALLKHDTTYDTENIITMKNNMHFYAKWEEGLNINFLFADNEGTNGVNFADYPNSFKQNEIKLPVINFGDYTLLYFENSDLSGKVYFSDKTYNDVDNSFPKTLYAAWFYTGRACYDLSGNNITKYKGNYHSIYIPEPLNVVDRTFTLFGGTSGTNQILKRIILNSNITQIANYMFANCTALEQVIPFGTLTRIGNYAFENCKSLDDLAFEDVSSVGTAAFSGCTLLDLTLGTRDSLTIANDALFGESVTIYTDTLTADPLYAFPNNEYYKIYVASQNYWQYYQYFDSTHKPKIRSLEKFNISVMLNDEVYTAFLGVRKGETIILPNTHQNSYYVIAGGGGQELPRNLVLGNESGTDYLNLVVNEVNYIYGYTGEYYTVSFKYADGEPSITGPDGFDINTLKVKSYKGSVNLPIITHGDYRLVWFEDYTATGNCYYVNNVATVLSNITLYGVWFHYPKASSFTRTSRSVSFTEVSTSGANPEEVNRSKNVTTVKYNGSAVNVIFPDEYISSLSGTNGFYLDQQQKNGIKRVILESKINGVYNNAFYKSGTNYSIKFIYTCGAIESVGDNAFNGCTNLVSIDLLSVVSIGTAAFKDCKNLVKVNVNEQNFTGKIGNEAFSGCLSLQQILFSYVRGIGTKAFYNCKSLTSPVDVGEYSLLPFAIGNDAFHGCTNIAYIKLGPKVTDIGGGAFYNCKSVRRVTINATFATSRDYDVGNEYFLGSDSYPFGNCGDNVGFELEYLSSYVPDYMFYTNHLETNYTRAEYTTKETVFTGPKIVSIAFKGSNITIGNGAFEGMQACAELLFGSNLTDVTIRSKAFYKSTSLLKVRFDNTGTISIGESVFEACRKLCIFEGGRGLTSAGNNYIKDIYPETSYIVGVTSNRTLQVSMDGSYTCLIEDSKKLLISINYFADQIIMDSNLLPVDCVDYMAQYNKHLNRIILSCTVGEYSFNKCVELTEVIFSNCVVYEKEIKRFAFAECVELSSVMFDSSDVYATNFKTIKESAFEGCEKLVEFVFPESCLTLEKAAFKDCKSLASVNFNTALTIIGEEGFAGCSSLRRVDMFNSITEIGKSAFSGCVRLVYIKFSQNLLKIGEEAFFNCTSLGLVEDVGFDEAGDPVTSKAYLELPSSLDRLEGLGKHAFYNTSNLFKIKILKNDDILEFNEAFVKNRLTEIHVYAYVLGDYLDNWGKSQYQNYKNFILIDPTGYSRPWDGSNIEPCGTGTETDPYLIASGRHVQWIINKINNGTTVYKNFYFRNGVADDSYYIQKYFYMKCNIDLNNQPYYPPACSPNVFSQGTYFAGIFEGNGFTIKNLNIPYENTSIIYFGGFVGVMGVGNTSAKTRVQNLTVHHTGSDVRAGNFGGIVGYMSNTKAGRPNTWGNFMEGGDILVENCKTTGSITCKQSAILSAYASSPYYLSDELYYGGILGMTPMERSVIRCISDLDITISGYAGDSYIAGVVGWTNGNITHCGNSGTIYATSTRRCVVGGITSIQGGNIGACFNTGTLRGTSNSPNGYTSEHNGRTLIGGITGYCGDTSVKIVNCFNTGNITGISNSSYAEANVGGIIGCNSSSSNRIARVYNTGTVTGRAPNFQCTVGGISGNNYSRMEYVISAGIVSMSSKNSNDYYGGLTGFTSNIASYYSCRIKAGVGSTRICHPYNSKPTIGTSGATNGVLAFGSDSAKTYTQTFGSGTAYNVVDMYSSTVGVIDLSYFYEASYDIMPRFSTQVWLFNEYDMPELKWIQLNESVNSNDAFKEP